MNRLSPEGAEANICRTFSAGLTFGYFQTFHIWLRSVGGFAAKQRSFDAVSLASGD
jgi:hypothetical protein